MSAARPCAVSGPRTPWVDPGPDGSQPSFPRKFLPFDLSRRFENSGSSFSTGPGRGRRLIVEEKLGRSPTWRNPLRFSSPWTRSKGGPGSGRIPGLGGENPRPARSRCGSIPRRCPGSPRVLEAYGLTELADIRYQPVLVQAILQVQFYSRFLALVRGAALSLGVALLLGSMWLSGPKRAESGAGESSSEAAGVSWAVSAVGLAMGLFSGAGLSYLLISPIRQLSGLH